MDKNICFIIHCYFRVFIYFIIYIKNILFYLITLWYLYIYHKGCSSNANDCWLIVRTNKQYVIQTNDISIKILIYIILVLSKIKQLNNN